MSAPKSEGTASQSVSAQYSGVTCIRSSRLVSLGKLQGTVSDSREERQNREKQRQRKSDSCIIKSFIYPTERNSTVNQAQIWEVLSTCLWQLQNAFSHPDTMKCSPALKSTYEVHLVFNLIQPTRSPSPNKDYFSGKP